MLDQYDPRSAPPAPLARRLANAVGCVASAALRVYAGWEVARIRYENTPQVGWCGTGRMAQFLHDQFFFGLIGLVAGPLLYLAVAWLGCKHFGQGG